MQDFTLESVLHWPHRMVAPLLMNGGGHVVVPGPHAPFGIPTAQRSVSPQLPLPLQEAALGVGLGAGAVGAGT